MSARLRRAAFLDRDGTLVEDRHYLSDASAMRLLPGVAAAVRRLNAAGIETVVVTNQSGIAQGLITEAQYEATRRRLAELMLLAGARLSASYHCPHHPEVSGPCECRKPGTALYARAARELDVDLTRSLYAGDRFRDVAPGISLGGTAILVPSANTPAEDVTNAEGVAVVLPTLDEAVTHFLRLAPGP